MLDQDLSEIYKKIVENLPKAARPVFFFLQSREARVFLNFGPNPARALPAPGPAWPGPGPARAGARPRASARHG